MAEPSPAPERRPAAAPFNAIALLRRLLFFLLPTLAGLGAWYLLAANTGLGKVGDFWRHALFGVVLIVVGFVVGFYSDAWAARRLRQAHPDAPAPSARRRAAGILLRGILTPLLVVVAVNLVPGPRGQSLLTTVMQRITEIKVTPVVAGLGQATLSAKSADAKCEGVNALKAVHSEDALAELLRLVEADAAGLKDRAYYEALAQALASFDAQAREPLLKLLEKLAPPMKPRRSESSRGLYAKILEPNLRGLRQRIQSEVSDTSRSEKLLAHLGRIESWVKAEIDLLESQLPDPDGGEPALELPLDTLLQIKSLQADPEVDALARRIAADPGFASATRGKAMLLMGKVGTEGDLEELLGYARSGNDLLQRNSLRAIATLSERLRKKE